jgi:hypothetical protein
MSRFVHRAATLLALLLPSAAAFGQGFPVPSSVPGTEVTCSVTDCAGRKTVGYSLPLKAFTGRFLDSSLTRDYQAIIRTSRARRVRLSPDGKRLYFIMGSLFAAYDKAAFFSRLETKEPLMSIYAMPIANAKVRAPGPTPPGEVLLRPDTWFYAQYTGFWPHTPVVDGQDRLNAFDLDDRGYAYLSHYVFNWGIVKDTGENTFQPMPSQSQVWPPDGDPVQIMAVRSSGGHYYAVVDTSYKTQIWNVDDVVNPVDTGKTLPFLLHNYAKSNFGYVAMDDNNGAIRIYNVDSMVTGGEPVATIAAPTLGRWGGVATDGNNFYAIGTSGGRATIGVIRANAGGTFSLKQTVVTNYFGSPQIAQANDGYLTLPLFSGQLLLYKIDPGQELSEMVIRSTAGLTNNYFGDYYGNVPGGNYVAPGSYAQPYDALVTKVGSKTYLIFCDSALADVYEIQPAVERRRTVGR